MLLVLSHPSPPSPLLCAPAHLAHARSHDPPCFHILSSADPETRVPGQTVIGCLGQVTPSAPGCSGRGGRGAVRPQSAWNRCRFRPLRSICYREGKTRQRGGTPPRVIVEPATTLGQGGRSVKRVEHHSSIHTSAQLSKPFYISTCRPQAGHCGLSSDWHHGPPCLVVLMV